MAKKATLFPLRDARASQEGVQRIQEANCCSRQVGCQNYGGGDQQRGVGQRLRGCSAAEPPLVLEDMCKRKEHIGQMTPQDDRII